MAESRAKVNGSAKEFRAKAVILACGGFEANPEWRARYLGPGWDLAKVRGTRFNMGDGLKMALKIGASAFGKLDGKACRFLGALCARSSAISPIVMGHTAIVTPTRL